LSSRTRKARGKEEGRAPTTDASLWNAYIVLDFVLATSVERCT
jgi:hypothetical protein